MMIEIPLASFFLSKMLGQKNLNVDIDHLQSLDPEIYKNLLYLKVRKIVFVLLLWMATARSSYFTLLWTSLLTAFVKSIA